MKNGLCECGCGQRTPLAPFSNKSKGMVRGEPRRFMPGHHFKYKSFREYEVSASGCWIWLRSKNWAGYGRAWRGRIAISAHRKYYEDHKGAIPPGMVIDHLCRTRACVNPEHLEVVSCRENVRRGNLTKLTADKVAAIKSIGGKMRQKDIAALFGTSKANVGLILNGRAWVDIR